MNRNLFQIKALSSSLAFLLVLNLSSLYGQWQVTIGGSGDDEGNALIFHNGSYEICGSTDSYSSNMIDPTTGRNSFLLRLDANGDLQDAVATGLFNLFTQTDETAVALVPSTNSSNTTGVFLSQTKAGTNSDYFFNSPALSFKGGMPGPKTYGSSTRSEVSGPMCLIEGAPVTTTYEGDVLMLSDIQVGSGNRDFGLLHINKANGNPVSHFLLAGGSYNDVPRSLVMIDYNNRVVGGYREGYETSATELNGMLVSLDAGSNVNWAKDYDEYTSGSSDEKFLSVSNNFTNGSAELAAAGYSTFESGGLTGANFLFAQLSASTGSLITGTSAYMYGGAGDDIGHHLIQTADGGFLLVGLSESFRIGHGTDVLVIKITDDGDVEWSRVYGGNQDETFNEFTGLAVHQKSDPNDEGYVIVASTESFGNGGKDVFVINTDIDGVSTGNNSCDSAVTVTREAISLAGNSFSVSRTSESLTSGTPFVEYNDASTDDLETCGGSSSPRMAAPQTEFVPEKFEVFPNPSTGNVTISWKFDNYTQFSVQVVDVSGRIVKEIDLQDESSGSMDTNLTNLPSGLYLLRLSGDGNFIRDTKFIKD